MTDDDLETQVSQIGGGLIFVVIVCGMLFCASALFVRDNRDRIKQLESKQNFQEIESNSSED